jgi:hypothetical protein
MERDTTKTSEQLNQSKPTRSRINNQNVIYLTDAIAPDEATSK